MRSAAVFGLSVALAFGAPAQAQGPSPQAQAQVQTSRMMEVRYDPGDTRAHYGSLECLSRKSDHKRVCHTREEWRVIASRIEHDQARSR